MQIDAVSGLVVQTPLLHMGPVISHVRRRERTDRAVAELRDSVTETREAARHAEARQTHDHGWGAWDSNPQPKD